MRRLLALVLTLLCSPAVAQHAAQPPNLFQATPLIGTGFLNLRQIGLADISPLLTLGNLGLTRSGTTTVLGTTSGTLLSGHCVQFDASGNLTDAGGACTTGGGGGTVSSGFVNQLAFYAATGTAISGLATANNGVLKTDGSGVPSIATVLPCLNHPALSGDLTTPASSCATTLSTVNANVGGFGSSTAIPNITVNAKGLVTALSVSAVVAPAGTLTGGTLASGVTASSLTSVGTLAGLTVTGSLTATGLVTNADLVNSGTTVNGVLCTLGSTCAAPALPALTSTDIWVGNGSNVATAVALSGDCTLSNAGAITCTKTSGTSFATSATTDTTNAANISSGTLPVGRGGTGATTFTANLPLIGNGTSAVAQGTRSGNTTVFGTASGTLTNGHCVQIDANGNFVDAGGACTVGGGGGTVSSGAINQLAWYSAAGTTLVGLATANNGMLATNGSGVPAIVSTLPAANHPALTGDITTSAGALATTLATVNANTGAWGSSTAIPNFTVNGKGLITAAGTNVVIAPAGTLTGATLAAGVTASSLTSVGTLASLGSSGAITDTQAIAATSTDGLLLTDVTAATSGAQKWSPRVHFTGQGWKTNATAGSQTVDVIEELQPVQGAANPSGNLVWSRQINGGGYGVLLTLPTGGGLNLNSGTYQIGGVQIAFSNIGGSLACAQTPALTGDVTTSAGSCATAIGSGKVTNANLVNSGTTVNGVLCTLGSTCTATAAAGTLTGATLASGVTASSLTGVGTLTSGGTGTGFTLAFDTSTMTGQVPVANGGTGAATFTANTPLIGNGTSAIAQGTVSGNTTEFVTQSGSTTTGQCAQFDANGNTISAPCGGAIPPVEHGGRLTLQAGVPVMTPPGVSGQTSLYYAPYKSAFIAIYNGTTFANYQFTSGPSDNTGLALGTFGSGWTVSTVYDVFVTLSSGSPVLCTGPDWTSFNVRSSAGSVGKYNSQYVNSNASAMTCRTSNSATISVPQYQATYVGTIATRADGTLSFLYGGLASGGSKAVLYVWNYYNRVQISTYNFDTSTQYTFKGPTPGAANWRQANASSENRIYFIAGQIEDACIIWYQSFDKVLTGVNGGFVLSGIVENVAGVPVNADVISSGALWAPVSGATVISLQGVTSTYWSFACNPVGLDWIQAVEAGDGNNLNVFGIFGGNQLNFTYPM